MNRLTITRRAVMAVGVLAALALTGCGDRQYPVQGTVALEDGTPVTRGLVVCERVDGGPPVTVQGEIRPDGTFKLGTAQPGDGVPAGRYQVLINPMDLSDVPDERKDVPFDPKYLNFKTSGLELNVKGATDYPIRLGPNPRRKGR